MLHDLHRRAQDRRLVERHDAELRWGLAEEEADEEELVEVELADITAARGEPGLDLEMRAARRRQRPLGALRDLISVAA